MSSSDPPSKTTAVYNAAADTYDHPANAWERFSRRTIERLGPGTGQRILDVCCGSASAALAAAEATTTTGTVVGIDLADRLLALAEAKARERGLANLEFRRADMLDLPFESSSFDLVVCVFGIFFADDMERAAGELGRVLRPGGRVALTTWGPRVFEPAASALWTSVESIRPDLARQLQAWERLSSLESVRELLGAAGFEVVQIEIEEGTHPIAAPEDWWTVVMGSGYRGLVEEMSVAERESLREACLETIRAGAITSIEANVIYAIGTRS